MTQDEPDDADQVNQARLTIRRTSSTSAARSNLPVSVELSRAAASCPASA